MAQVPGRGPSRSQYLSSDEYSPVNCQPCTTRGKTFPAKSYCEDCKENLCQACCDYHSALKISRHHRLSDIITALAGSNKQQGSRPTIYCQLHADELVKFYCRKHNITVCAECAVEQHGHCDLHYIQDISFDFMNSDTFKDFLSDLNNLTIQVETFLQLTEDNDKKTAENGQQLIEVLEHRREEMVKFINKKTDELKSELTKLQQGDLNKLGQIKNNFTKHKKELDDTKEFIEKVNEQSSDLLIKCTNMMTRFQAIQDDLRKAELVNMDYRYTFKTSDVSHYLLSSNDGIGTVIREEITLQAARPSMAGAQPPTTSDEATEINWATGKPEALQDLKVKYRHDDGTCDIRGIDILDPVTVLITDYKNHCIKRVNTCTAAITGYLKLPSGPWDTTQLEHGLAATTLPNKQTIQFFSTKGDMELLHDIKLHGECMGLSYTEDCRLVVGYKNPGKVEVIDKRGTVLFEIRKRLDGQDLFECPNYINVTKEGEQEVVYVSDCETDTLTKLSLTGQVLFTYKDKDMTCLAGVTVTGDGILVCSGGSHNVQVVSESGEKIATVLEKKDGVMFPLSVCYEASRKILYVGLLQADKLRRFYLLIEK